MKLALVAVILSLISLGVAISQPLWNLYSSLSSKPPSSEAPGKPIFVIQNFNVFQFNTQISILNNGTVIAHDVKVTFYFSGSTPLGMTQFIPNIENKTSVSFEIPLGSFQLTYDGSDLSSYQAHIAIDCEELAPTTTNFAFDL